jgi:hypothetical protein
VDTLGNSLAVSQIVKFKVIGSQNHILPRTNINLDMSVHSDKFIISKKWKKLNCPPSEYIKQIWHIQYNGMLFSPKRSEVLTHPTTQMNHENIRPNGKI